MSINTEANTEVTNESPAKNSTHVVEVVPVELTKHPGADLLSMIPVYGYTYVGRTEDWIGVTKGAYIPPDSLVDAKRPEFAFLAPQAKGLDLLVRIKAKKLRGVVSFGLMVPVPDDTPLGEDWAERLGVTHYEPPLAHEAKIKGRGYVLGGEDTRAPAVYAPTYDLDAFRRYHKLFTPGEPVHASEKLDGANARFTFHDGRFHCGTRTRWTKEFSDHSHVTVEFLTNQGCTQERAEEIIARLAAYPKRRNIWWQALRDTPALEEFLRLHPETVVYGEVAGSTNVIKYSSTNHFASFDIMQGGRWLSHTEARGLAPDLPWVPTLAENLPYSFDAVCALAEGDTTWDRATAKVIREGCVVKPAIERQDERLGRVALKVVSGAFLERYR